MHMLLLNGAMESHISQVTVTGAGNCYSMIDVNQRVAKNPVAAGQSPQGCPGFSAASLLTQGVPVDPGCWRRLGRQVWGQEGAQFWGDMVVHGNRLDPTGSQPGAASAAGHASLHGSG